MTSLLRTIAITLTLGLVASGCVFSQWISVAPGGITGTGNVVVLDVSVDGRYVLFSSETKLVAGDGNATFDIHRTDTLTGDVVLVSVDSGGNVGNDASLTGEMSDDGNLVVFRSNADNLVPGDMNMSQDIFLRDIGAGTTTLVSESTGGGPGNAFSFDPAISADGTVVAFGSAATDLIPSDTNGAWDVFAYTVASGAIQSVSRNGLGIPSNGDSRGPSLNTDGTIIAFSSDGTNLVAPDTNGSEDIFAKSVFGPIELVSITTSGGSTNGDSFLPSISGSGLQVAFATDASNVVAGDTNGNTDIFMRDLGLGVTLWSSIRAGGVQPSSASSASIDASGQFVAWTAGTVGITYVTDHINVGFGVAASKDRDGNPVSGGQAAISGDGRWVAAQTATAVDPADTNGTGDVYLFDWRQPVPTSVTPSTLLPGSTTSVTITGTEFETGATLTGSVGLSFANVVVVDAQTITADVTVSATTPSGGRSIFVNAPDGGPGFFKHSIGECACVTVP